MQQNSQRHQSSPAPTDTQPQNSTKASWTDFICTTNPSVLLEDQVCGLIDLYTILPNVFKFQITKASYIQNKEKEKSLPVPLFTKIQQDMKQNKTEVVLVNSGDVTGSNHLSNDLNSLLKIPEWWLCDFQWMINIYERTRPDGLCSLPELENVSISLKKADIWNTSCANTQFTHYGKTLHMSASMERFYFITLKKS